MSGNTIENAVEQALRLFARENPGSGKAWEANTLALPGGVTRGGLYFKPFPIILTKGQGVHVWDADDKKYLDFCGEYAAGLFGHNHAVIAKAMIDAIQKGTALGGVNPAEGKAAALLATRFESVDKVRFCNSGTEADQMAFQLARAYTGRSMVMFFEGGYHGALASFLGKPVPGAKSMNVPVNIVVGDYNDIEGTRKLIREYKDDLACVAVELMQAGGGCIPADLAFVEMLREETTAVGSLLLFDEVVTSRSAYGGLQSRLGIKPDLTTVGKWIGGGSCNFGAFGGSATVMDLLDPTKPGFIVHSGTFNNNVITMKAMRACLEEVYTAEEANRMWDLGEYLRNEINKAATDAGVGMQATGCGSTMTVHFTRNHIRSRADLKTANQNATTLFYLDMLHKGIHLAARGMICMMTPHTKEDVDKLVKAVKEFIQERKEYIV
ncbi:putative aminotransferase class-iii protein [Ilyonectria robusta]